MNKKVLRTLKQRGENYYDYNAIADTAQALKNVIRGQNASRGMMLLSNQQHEALDMICMKIARIVIGKSDLQDNWIDIAGYAMLGSGMMEKEDE
jgi:hypothetical protein